MKILGIDTSTSTLSIAVLDENKVTAQCNKDFKKRTSDALIPTVKSVLKKANIELSAIDAFAVGLGPGSFTGLRIGVSAVKGLSFATGKPILGIPSLDTIAFNALPCTQYVCPLIDARRNKIYACVYKPVAGTPKKVSSYLLTDIDSLLQRISKPIIFLGDAVSLYRDAIEKKLGKKALFEKHNQWYPRAQNVVRLAKERYNTLKKVNPKSVTPLYLYPKECQIKTVKRK
ncbi:tRNA (adenosine(37)-N6)-threonylcarbamoyltransferase complex dimerization subunit type 1 TsaB [Candidatus Omnitrophota bacterium]